ncbi:alanine racemase [Collinsella sp. An2]|uniref:diaminopimelate decarboxylase family protein n=1 Tax=Collinsella sp. An2 TaxID=1965585 RepID=UPI000B3A6669|nr:alanine racemase [Collinsella sp. An2]OUP11135.1 hypothetical protein B5F33_01845 [Collinsella sp. An2]
MTGPSALVKVEQASRAAMNAPSARPTAGLSDGVLGDVAQRFGTPLYVFDERALAERTAFLRASLPQGVGLCYAMKANTFVLPQLSPLVDRVEVCSPGEYRICRTVGVPQGRLVISGVHKDEATVAAALADAAQPATVTIESEAQMRLVDQLAQRFGLRVPVLLRLTSANQFGLDACKVRELAGRYLRATHIELRGVQYFSGTQKTSAKRIGREIEKLDRFLASLEQECGWRAPEFEYGPGLPVAYFEADAFDERSLLVQIGRHLQEMSFTGDIVLEVGRSLVASCGTYLTSVVDTKCNRGQRYAIVDGGTHQLVYFGQSMAMRQPSCRLLRPGTPGEAGADRDHAACERVAGSPAADARTTCDHAAGDPAADTPATCDGLASAPDSERELWNVFGSLCTVNDVLAKQMPLCGLREQDVLAFSNAGAYCATEGIALFLSRDLPRVVVLDRAGEPHVVRDALRTDPLNTPSSFR